MKRVLLLLALCVPASAQQGSTPLAFYNATWGGVDNYHDSARIDNGDFTDARNILTDRGYVEKRPGALKVIEAVKSGYPVSYLKSYVTQSNQKYFILQASTIIYRTDFSGDPVQIATVNVNGITDSLSAYNKHFFVNGYDTPFYYDGTKIVQVPQIPSGCKYLMFSDERLWCANSSGAESTLSASAYGDYADWTIPTGTTLPADAANAFTMDKQDGKPITCVFSSPYGKLIWKRSKMFIIKGEDNDSFYKFRISDNVGCTDNRSVRLVDGAVTWLGELGIYQWSGGNNPPVLISEEIDPTVKSVRQSVSASDNQQITSKANFDAGRFYYNGTRPSWDADTYPGSLLTAVSSMTDTTGVDFASGTLTNVSTVTVPNSVVLAYTGASALLDNFDDNNYTANPTWTCTGDCSSVVFNVPLNTGKAALYTTSGSKSATLTTPYVSKNYGVWKASMYVYYVGTVRYVFISSSTSNSNYSGYALELKSVPENTDNATLTLYKVTAGANTALTSASAAFGAHNYTIERNESGGMTIKDGSTKVLTSTDTTFTFDCTDVKFYLSGTRYSDNMVAYIDWVYAASQYNSTGRFVSRAMDTGFANSIGGMVSISDYRPTGTGVTYSVAQADSKDDSAFTSWTTVPDSTTFRAPFTKRYYKWAADLTTSISTNTPRIDEVSITAVSSGTWDSDVLYVGETMSSWGQFSAVTDAQRDGLVDFYVRASTGSFDKTDVYPLWAYQENGQNVSYSTGTHVQVRAVDHVASSTDAFTIASFTLNWYNGDSKSVSSLFYDGRYYLCANTSSGTLINDLCMVYQRNKKWTLFDGQSWGALELYDNKPYAGDGTSSSRVYRVMEKDLYRDDTSPIRAYFSTKDYQFDAQNQDKVLRLFYLESTPTTASQLLMSYAMNRAAGYSTPISLDITYGQTYNEEVKRMFPGFVTGKYARFRFYNNVLDQMLKVDAFTVLGDINALYRR